MALRNVQLSYPGEAQDPSGYDIAATLAILRRVRAKQGDSETLSATIHSLRSMLEVAFPTKPQKRPQWCASLLQTADPTWSNESPTNGASLPLPDTFVLDPNERDDDLPFLGGLSQAITEHSKLSDTAKQAIQQCKHQIATLIWILVKNSSIKEHTKLLRSGIEILQDFPAPGAIPYDPANAHAVEIAPYIEHATKRLQTQDPDERDTLTSMALNQHLFDITPALQQPPQWWTPEIKTISTHGIGTLATNTELTMEDKNPEMIAAYLEKWLALLEKVEDKTIVRKMEPHMDRINSLLRRSQGGTKEGLIEDDPYATLRQRLRSLYQKPQRQNRGRPFPQVDRRRRVQMQTPWRR